MQEALGSTSLLKVHVVGSNVEPGKSQQLQEDAWKASYATGEVVEPPHSLEALASLYETNAAHKACVDAKVTNIVGLGYRLVPMGDEAEASEDNLGLLQHLFANCNRQMTFVEVMRGVWTDVECVGNGYVEVTRNNLGEIDGLYHVPAVTVRVRADRDGYVQIRDGRKRHFRGLGAEERADEETGLVQNEIMHFYKYTPQSSYYGVPDVIPALTAMLGDKAACEHNLDFFEHNAVPRLAIIVEGAQLSDGLLGQIQHYMESELKGQAHKTLVLETPGAGAKVRIEPLTVSKGEEAGFIEYLRHNRDQVLMVHRVPPAKVTVIEDSNRANAADQDKTFREQVVRPEQRRVEFKINSMIRNEIGISDWEFRFREMDLSEELQEAEIARIYADIGAWSVNEIRAQQGLLPVVEAAAGGEGEG